MMTSLADRPQRNVAGPVSGQRSGFGRLPAQDQSHTLAAMIFLCLASPDSVKLRHTLGAWDCQLPRVAQLRLPLTKRLTRKR